MRRLDPDPEWMRFREFPDRRAAQGLALWLRNEQVTARAEDGAVFIAARQLHRARWVLAQLPPTEEDLDLLAAAES
jgi:hypothetical protein